MSKFKVGDKVRVKRTGLVGTITRAEYWRMFPYMIEDDPLNEPFEGAELEPVEREREFIIILREGNKTIAELRHGREVVKSAEAKCMPTDTFDFFNEGAPRAFDRLMGREEQKPQPAPKFKVGDRVVCDEFGEGIVELVNYEFLPQTAYIICLKNERRAIVDECDLSPAPEPKYYTGKVVCISGNYKVGKIYTVVNGLFNEVGFNRLGGTPYTSVDDMNSTFCFGKFAEVKE